MSGREVVELVEALGEAALSAQQCICANPRCDEMFFQAPGPGRRKTFHDEDCRRNAGRDLRQAEAQLAHYERQVDQMRARVRAYIRTNFEDVPTTVAGPTDEQRLAAREAVAEVRGMARFLENHEDQFARDLLKLFRAVEPIV